MRAFACLFIFIFSFSDFVFLFDKKRVSKNRSSKEKKIGKENEKAWDGKVIEKVATDRPTDTDNDFDDDDDDDDKQ